MVYKDFQSDAFQVRERRLLNYFLDASISFGLVSEWSLMSELCINIQLVGSEPSMEFSPLAVSPYGPVSKTCLLQGITGRSFHLESL